VLKDAKKQEENKVKKEKERKGKKGAFKTFDLSVP